MLLANVPASHSKDSQKRGLTRFAYLNFYFSSAADLIHYKIFTNAGLLLPAQLVIFFYHATSLNNVSLPATVTADDSLCANPKHNPTTITVCAVTYILENPDEGLQSPARFPDWRASPVSVV